MAQNRTGSKRRLVTLITVGLLIASCGQETGPRYGWFAAEAIETLPVSPDARSILLRVELPAGHVEADDFVQRATIFVGSAAQTAQEFDLQERLEIPISPGTWQNSEVYLELLLGFCEYDVKEVCYIDTPRIRVDVRTDLHEQFSSDTIIMYRPEPPQ